MLETEALRLAPEEVGWRLDVGVADPCDPVDETDGLLESDAPLEVDGLVDTEAPRVDELDGLFDADAPVVLIDPVVLIEPLALVENVEPPGLVKEKLNDLEVPCPGKGK